MIKISSAEYHARPEVSNSLLGFLKKSPAHYKAFLDGDLVFSSDAMDLGSMVHAAILEPDFFAQMYAVGPDAAKNTTLWKNAQSASSRTLIKPDDMAKIMRMRDAVLHHHLARKIIDGAEIEMSGFWTDPATDVKCRFRPDIIKKSDRGIVLADLKTTRDASPDGFAKSVVNYSYYRQAAFYLDGYEACTGDTPSDFIFIAVETEPPYICETYCLPHEAIAKGRQEYSDLLFTLDECIRLDRWPGYSSSGLVEIEMPKWF